MKSLARLGLGILAALTSAFFILGAAVLSLTEEALLLTPTPRTTSVRVSMLDTLTPYAAVSTPVRLIPVTALFLRPNATSVAGDWLLDPTDPTVTPDCPPPPAGWISYRVQPGDMLSRLSLNFGVSIADIQYYNCLGSSDMIRYGETLFLPNVFTPTPLASPSPEPTLTPTPVSTETPAPTQTVTPSPSATAPVEDTQTPTQTEIPTDEPGN